MTTDRAFKRAVRERMVQTGEKYTIARRALAGHDGGNDVPREDPITAALQPGRVTGVVCGGGLTNLALILPYLLRAEDEGHHLVTVAHGRGGRRDLVADLPSTLDFVSQRGLATIEEIADALTGDMTMLDEAVRQLPDSSIVPGPMRDSRLIERLRELDGEAGPPIVWVQDIQTDPPLARGGEGGFDGIGEQLNGLRRIARETGAIIALGHCMPPEEEESWEVVRDGTDDTFVITYDDMSSDPSDERALRIEHHAQDQPAYEFQRKVDHGFSSWRYLYFERRR